MNLHLSQVEIFTQYPDPMETRSSVSDLNKTKQTCCILDTVDWSINQKTMKIYVHAVVYPIILEPPIIPVGSQRC